jgi:hypothetical protein
MADALEAGSGGSDGLGDVSLAEVVGHMNTRLSGRHPLPKYKFDGSGDLAISKRARPVQASQQYLDPKEQQVDRTVATIPGKPDAERLTLGAHLANLTARHRKDYSYGDISLGLMHLVLSVVIALLAAGMAVSEESLLYPNYDEYELLYREPLMDPDLFLLYCAVLLTFSAILAMTSIMELVVAGKYARQAESRREFLEMLSRPYARRVRGARDIIAFLFAVPVFVALISEDLPIIPYSLAISLCGAIFGTVCISRIGYGDASYLAASALVLAGVFTPRAELGYGSANDFSSVVIALQMISFVVMLFTWWFRLSRKSLTLAALSNLLPILIFSLQTRILPGVSTLGMGLALFGCALGDGVPLPLGAPIGRLGSGTIGPIRLFRQAVSSR